MDLGPHGVALTAAPTGGTTPIVVTMVARERFVPQRTGQLITDLAGVAWDDPADAGRFRAFGRLVAALYHFEFHDRSQTLVDAWEASVDGTDPDAASDLTAQLSGLLDAANYTPVSMAELDEAMARESLIPLRFEVDLGDYDEVLIYRRGSHQRTVEIPKWRGLRTEEKTITVDERVIVHTRVKPQSWFDDQKIDPADRNLVPGHVSLKLFQNVPRADIEMLLPSTQVRFRTIDTLTVAVPAVASGVVVLATKLGPTLALMFLLILAWLGIRDQAPDLDQAALVVLFGGALTLGGFFFRQWNKLKNRRVAYLKTLSENLYFRTLADGPGVVHTLLSTAEQQEVVEVLLSYRFALRHPLGTTPAILDREIEEWLATACEGAIDFEIGDALDKLRRLAVVDGKRMIRPIPLDDALSHLDRRWDDLFRYQPDELVDGNGHGAEDRSSLVQLRRVVDRFTGRVGDRLLRREEPIGS